MPFSNEVVGGNGVLVRNTLQSQNFVSGVSGWQVTKNGNAEFNNGTFRGQLTSGTNPGQHIILNSAATGDAVDVYDLSNQLVYSIDNLGQASSINPATGLRAVSANGEFSIYDTPTGNRADYIFALAPNNSQPTELAIECSPSGAANYILELQSGSVDGTKKPALLGSNGAHTGYIAQTDGSTTGNLFHIFSGSGTTDGSGKLAINTGALFNTISLAFVMYDQTLRSAGPSCSAVYYDLAPTLGTQWFSGGSTFNTSTVFYKGIVFA